MSIKESQVKQNSQECFDGKINDETKNREKLLKILKKPKLHQGKNKVKEMIFNKNRIIFRKNLSKSIVTPKELWMVLKSLGSSNESSSWETSALKINNTVEHNANSVLEGFKNYYSTLAESLVKMPPKVPNKYSINTVIEYREHMIQGDHFDLASVPENWILTILKATQFSKAAGFDSLSFASIFCFFQSICRFLKDGA